MADDDGRNPLHNREAEYFMGMHKACVEGANRDHLDILHDHLDIQTDGPKVLFVSVCIATSAKPKLQCDGYLVNAIEGTFYFGSNQQISFQSIVGVLEERKERVRMNRRAGGDMKPPPASVG